MELFCTPKSSMENPSLRVSVHVSRMKRTFIVEEYAEDEFGQWAKDEVTGEQGYVDDEKSCFWTWDDTEGVQTIKGRQLRRRKGKGNGKGKGQHKDMYKGSGRAFLGEEQAQNSGGPKDAKARKDSQEAMMAFRRVVFAQSRIIPRTKQQRKVPKRKKQRRSSPLIRTFSL